MSKKLKVLLTNPIHPHFFAELAQQCEVVVAPDTKPETLKALIVDCDGLMVRSQLPPDIFDDAKQLKAVVRHGVGLDFIPVEAATKKKIAVANLPGSNTNAVVEYCLAVIFHFRRRLNVIDSILRDKGWATARPLADDVTEIQANTIGIIGIGSIGGALAKAATNLNMQVIALTRRPENLPKEIRGVSKSELFSQADVIAICCPLNDQTRGLVDASAIALMKPSAILINVARGPVVDTKALIAALKAGKISGVAMDVHDEHPLTGQEEVFNCPNLLLTPHLAAITATSMRGMSEGAVKTLLALLRGEHPSNTVNPAVFTN